LWGKKAFSKKERRGPWVEGENQKRAEKMLVGGTKKRRDRRQAPSTEGGFREQRKKKE